MGFPPKLNVGLEVTSEDSLNAFLSMVCSLLRDKSTFCKLCFLKKE